MKEFMNYYMHFQVGDEVYKRILWLSFAQQKCHNVYLI
jgi:hypothetical protein